jgi:23S rRNA pseudouridine1911/1915/1917 synthase
MRIQIIYEDKDVLVIYKPAGLATQTSKIGQADAVSECKNYLGTPYLGVVHRLDQPVEGLLAFAKNKKAAASLTDRLEKNASSARGGQQGEGQFHKQYYAVICGKPAVPEGDLVDYLTKEKDRAVVDDKNGKMAKLHFRQVSEAVLPEGETLSLLDISIATGRFHQIRAQLSHAGMPLLGDLKYADEQTLLVSGSLGIRNVALCAYSLTFVHPVTGRQECFQIRPKGTAFSYFNF